MGIVVYDKDNKVVETFRNSQDMYNRLSDRYSRLQRKRKADMNRAFWKGWWISAGIVLFAQAVVLIIGWLL